MRKLLLTNGLIFLTITVCLGQQTNDTLYFNSRWKECAKGEHTYYRLISKDSQGLFDLTDYWKNGQVQMAGKYSSLNPEIREGKFTWYYSNGKTRQIIKYDYNIVIDKIKNFKPTGEFDIEYCVTIDSLDNSNEIHNGITDFRKYIYQNLRYPKKARKKEIQGKVMTKFFINPNGEIERFIILTSISEDLDAEAKRVVLSGYKFATPVYKGEKTYFEIVCPINFVLQ